MIAPDSMKAWLLPVVMTPVAGAALCAALIILLRPLLTRYALARPNVRSSHKIPTPQGGGIAVIGATVAIMGVSDLLDERLAVTHVVAATVGAAVVLALLGMMDDLRPIPVLPRFLFQFAAVIVTIAALSPGLRIVPSVPFWMERTMLVVGLLWFVNLTNFMDGLDWMTVAEMLPITVALAGFGLAGFTATDTVPILLALSGALLGFAPFNRPVARLFLGDVGSLPLGLLIGWCLLVFAGNGHLVAALLLPLYYLADATLTLLLRLSRGDKVWVAHRTHFYQRATDNGFKVIEVVREVFCLNVLLAGLAAVSVALKSPIIDVLLLAAGAMVVAIVLIRFSRPKAIQLV